MNPCVVLFLILSLAACSRGATPEQIAAVRERLVKVAQLGEALAKDARISPHSGNQSRHPTFEQRGRYAALRLWKPVNRHEQPAGEWPRADDQAALRTLLLEKDSRLRALAAEALGTLNDPDDVPLIGELLSDNSNGPMTLHDGPLGRAMTLEPEPLDLDVVWDVKPVSVHARTTLFRMTGEWFTAESFAGWRARNLPAQEPLWIWQRRFYREYEALNMPDRMKDEDRDAWRATYPARVQQWRSNIVAVLKTLPPEIEAKIRLLAEHPGAGGADITQPGARFFDLTVILRIEAARIKQLLAREGLWTDIDWKNQNVNFYNRMFERLMLSAQDVFTPADAPWLIDLLQKEHSNLWWSGRAAGHIGISRLLPAAGKDLDDKATREGWLRAAVRTERDVFTAGYAARELIQIGVAANFDFIRDEFFKPDTRVPGSPNFPQSVLIGLGSKPLTPAKRAALIDLLLDSRSEPQWTRPLQRMGDDMFQFHAIHSVNAHAGKELITYNEMQALRAKATNAAALKSVLEKIRGLKEK